MRSFVSAISRACAMNGIRKTGLLRLHATSKPRGHPGGGLNPGDHRSPSPSWGPWDPSPFGPLAAEARACPSFSAPCPGFRGARPFSPLIHVLPLSAF